MVWHLPCLVDLGNVMENCEYKVIPLPNAVKVSKAGKSGETVAKFLEDSINEQAREGWKFVQVETLQAAEPAGCGSSNQFELVSQILAIFSRPATGSY